MGVIRKLNTLRKVNNKLGLLDAGDMVHLAMAYCTIKRLHNHSRIMPDIDLKKFSFGRSEEEEREEFIHNTLKAAAIIGGICLLAHNKGKIKEAEKKAIAKGEELKKDIEEKGREFVDEIDADDLVNDMYGLKKEIDQRVK